MYFAEYKNGKLIRVVGPEIEAIPIIYLKNYNDDRDGDRKSFTSVISGSSQKLLRQPKDLNGVQEEGHTTKS
jgi:hypothetical protein